MDMDGQELEAFLKGFQHDYPAGASDAERVAFTRGWKWGLAWLSSEFMQARAAGEDVVMQIGVEP